MTINYPKTFILRHKRYRVVLITTSAADARRKSAMYDERGFQVARTLKQGRWLVGVRKQ